MSASQNNLPPRQSGVERPRPELPQLAVKRRRPRQTGAARGRPVADRLALCLDYMRTHFDQPLNIATLSAMAGLSPSYFFLLFRRVTGDTPLNWLMQQRMNRAGELLRQTGLPVKQIAAQVAYDDPLYFSRVFKSVHGLAPTEYRARAVAPAN